MKKSNKLISIILCSALIIGLVPSNVLAVSKPTVTKKMTITVRQSKTIKVTGKYIKSKTFKSNKKSIATVNKKGKVTGKKVGTAKITVTVKYKKTKNAKKVTTKKYTCIVTVNAKKSAVPTNKPNITTNPTVTKKPNVTETPNINEKPKATPEPSKDSSGPQNTEVPNVTEAPKNSEEPHNTEVPSVTDRPQSTPDVPVTTETPKSSEEPHSTEVPSVTEEPQNTPDVPVVTEIPSNTDEPSVTETPESSEKPDSTEVPSVTEEPKNTPDVPSVTETPETVAEVFLQEKTLKMGMGEDEVIALFGEPNRKDTTRNGYTNYVYNSNYSELLMVGIAEDRVVSWYTDAVDFVYKGLDKNSDTESINRRYNKSIAPSSCFVQKPEENDTNTWDLLYVDVKGNEKLWAILVVEPGYLSQIADTTETFTSFEKEVFDMTNAFRVQNGISILEWHDQASIAARKHSQEMAVNEYFSHTDLNGGGPEDRLLAEGAISKFKGCGENIIAGVPGPAEAVSGWMWSSGHRDNLLGAGYTELGVGFASAGNKIYGTQCFVIIEKHTEAPERPEILEEDEPGLYNSSNYLVKTWDALLQEGTIVVEDGEIISTSGNFNKDKEGATIKIPHGITKIGYKSFSNQQCLRRILLPEGLEEIGADAFVYCYSIEDMYIPKTVKSIGKGLFGVCYDLKRVVVDEENPVYDSREECNAIIETDTNILISGCNNTIVPDGVVRIGFGAFSGCTELRLQELPTSVKVIENNAFTGCDRIINIKLPDGLEEIGSGAFELCDGLEKLTIPASVTKMGKYIVYKCPKLKEICLEEGLIEIASYTFGYADALESITIPASVKKIGYEVFRGCTSLKSLVVDSENPIFDSRENCNAIIRTEDNILCNGCDVSTIPDGITGIEGAAFSGCYGLTSIVIPESVTYIGRYAFEDCYSLQSISIPLGVTQISYASFMDCSSLKRMVIPEGVTVIEGFAFSNCALLENVALPESLNEIQSGAFSGCERLSSLYVPQNVYSIEDIAFSGVSEIIYGGVAEGAPWGALSVVKE